MLTDTESVRGRSRQGRPPKAEQYAKSDAEGKRYFDDAASNDDKAPPNVAGMR
jgi:hypothetical protein